MAAPARHAWSWMRPRPKCWLPLWIDHLGRYVAAHDRAGERDPGDRGARGAGVGDGLRRDPHGRVVARERGRHVAGGATGPQPGAKFRGTNRIGKRKWKTVATVVDAEPGRRFSFRVATMGLKVAEWSYAFEPTATGCRVTETWIEQRARFLQAARPTGDRRRGPCQPQPSGDGADPRAPRGGQQSSSAPS